MAIDAEKIRKDFPILSLAPNGKRLIYLDSAATSQKPAVVISKIKQYYEETNANVHRGVHYLSEKATKEYEGSRKTVAKFINASSTKEIIFTKNATEGINLVAESWGHTNLAKGDRILLTEMEHHSNIVPWQIVAKEKNAIIEYVKITKDFQLDLADFERKIALKPKIFAFAAVSNVLGTINPVSALVKKAKSFNCVTLVDAAQAVPHMPVDVQEWGCDFAVFSGHKMCAPTGIGVLYGKREVLESMEPWMGGGDMIKEVHFEGFSHNELPWKFEAGTPNIEGAIGLATAIDYLQKLGMSAVREHEKEITQYALEKLSAIKGLRFYCPKDPDKQGGVVSFNLGDIHAHDLSSILDEQGIAIRSGHHCAQPLMERLGIASAARASFYFYTTTAEVDALAAALEKAKQVFRIK
jgi:cysteine desulfurase/selenocysteine lyase